jgi:type I restriction enzyme S subunit
MSGNTPKGGEIIYVKKGIEFYRSQNVWKNKLEKDDIAYIDEETHKKMKKSSLKHNDLLITKTGRINTENSSLGRTALYDGEDDKANINGHVYLVRLNKNENHEFVLRILISDQYREHIRNVCVGGIDKRQLNKDHIEDFPIIYPPKDLQDDFIKKVKLIDKQKFRIEKSLEEIQKLQESLMNKYFK